MRLISSRNCEHPVIVSVLWTSSIQSFLTFPVNCHVSCLCSTYMNTNCGTRTCIITTQSLYLTYFMLICSFLQWLKDYTLACVYNRRVACGLSSSHTWLFLLLNTALYVLVYVEDEIKGCMPRGFLIDMHHTTQLLHAPSSNCGKLGLWM
jgi:hypothetical protein